MQKNNHESPPYGTGCLIAISVNLRNQRGGTTLFYATCLISEHSISYIKECGAATQVVTLIISPIAKARGYHKGCGSATLGEIFHSAFRHEQVPDVAPPHLVKRNSARLLYAFRTLSTPVRNLAAPQKNGMSFLMSYLS